MLGKVFAFFQAALPGLSTVFLLVSHLIKIHLLDAAGSACSVSAQHLYVSILLTPKWKCTIDLESLFLSLLLLETI